MIKKIIGHFLATAVALIGTNLLLKDMLQITPTIQADVGEYFKVILISALIFGVLNALVKPILKVLSFPLMIITFGLFSLVINMVLLFVFDLLLDSVTIMGFLSYLVVGVVLSILNWISHKLF